MVGISEGVLGDMGDLMAVIDALSSWPFASTDAEVLCIRYSSSMTKTTDRVLRSSSQPIFDTR